MRLFHEVSSLHALEIPARHTCAFSLSLQPASLLSAAGLCSPCLWLGKLLVWGAGSPGRAQGLPLGFPESLLSWVLALCVLGTPAAPVPSGVLYSAGNGHTGQGWKEFDVPVRPWWRLN